MTHTHVIIIPLYQPFCTCRLLLEHWIGEGQLETSGPQSRVLVLENFPVLYANIFTKRTYDCYIMLRVIILCIRELVNSPCIGMVSTWP